MVGFVIKGDVKNKPSYKIIFDRNVIWGRPIYKSVIQFIGEYHGNPNLDIEFFVPEMVSDESKKHFLNDFLDVKKRHDAASKDLQELQ